VACIQPHRSRGQRQVHHHQVNMKKKDC
jgi:hypothetical protein